MADGFPGVFRHQLFKVGLGAFMFLVGRASPAIGGGKFRPRFERGDELKERTIEALQRALEVAGIEFIDGNGGGPGVRLSGKSKRDTRKK